MSTVNGNTGAAASAEDFFPSMSVVLPTFNRRNSLRVTLDGLARQLYPGKQFEAVIVSDGSTDGTDALLEEYSKTAPFALRAIRQENAGPARARNRGIQEARGEIVVFIDDDVEPAPHFLRTHASHHRDDCRAVVIGPLSPDPALRGKEPSWITWEHAMLEKQYAAFRSGEWPEAGPNHFYSGNASLRREHLLHVGGFDETFTRQEDVELGYRLQRERQVRFLFDEAALGIHRPLRTFEGWMKVPYAYGRLDVVRARRGDVEWEVVRHGYAARSRATRLVANAALAAPALSSPLRGALRVGANLLYKGGISVPALSALSALYNLRYLEGARDEMGAVALRRLLRAPDGVASAMTSLPESAGQENRA